MPAERVDLRRDALRFLETLHLQREDSFFQRAIDGAHMFGCWELSL